MNRIFAAAFVFLVAILPATVAADDNALPPWREEKASIHEQWTFPNGDTPVEPDISKNIHGISMAEIVTGELGEGWFAEAPAGDQTGVWDFGAGGAITITLPQLTHNQQYGRMRVVFEYFKDGRPAPTVNVSNASLVERGSDVPLGDGWYSLAWLWQVPSTSDAPEITIAAPDAGSLIAQVEVDAEVKRWGVEGDTGGDCIVDTLDMLLVRKHFGKNPAVDDNWRFDLNEDGVINILDLIIVRNNMGRKCPAYDLDVIPDWRHKYYSIHEIWDFAADANPADPDYSKNIHGTSFAEMYVGQFGEGWFEELPTLSRSGFWDLGADGKITIILPELTHKQRYGRIRVRLDYYKQAHQAPTVSVNNASLVEQGPDVFVEGDPIGGGWYAEFSLWQTRYNLGVPQITISAPEHGSLISRVEVDAEIKRWLTPGDVNGDCKVDVLDLVLVQQNIGKDPMIGDNWRYDLNEDGVIDLLDVAIVQSNLRNTCPPFEEMD